MQSGEQGRPPRAATRRRRVIPKEAAAEAASLGQLVRSFSQRKAVGEILRIELAARAAGLTVGQAAIGLALETRDRVEMLVDSHERFASRTESTLADVRAEIAAVREQVAALDSDAGERLKLIEDALAVLIEEGQDQRVTAENVRHLLAALAPESGN